jgi:hypothetical protein
MPTKLTNISLKNGAQGAQICSATEGTLDDANGEILLTKGVAWQTAMSPLSNLETQVALTATIHRTGQAAKSFAQPKMFIIGIKDTGQVRVGKALLG